MKTFENQGFTPPPPPHLSYWKSIAYGCKAFIVALAVLFSFSASGQSISGATSVVAGQTYTYSSGCASTSWYVTNGTIIQNSGDGIVLIQWSSAGSGTISISGCAYLDVIVSNPPPPPYFCITPGGRTEGCDAILQFAVCNMPSNCGYVWTYKLKGQAAATTFTSSPTWGELSGCGPSVFDYVCVSPSCGSSPSVCASY